MISVEIKPDVVTWVPNPGGQTAFCADWTHPYCANEGGWGSGKSVGGGYKSLSLHLYNAFDAQGVPTRVMGAKGTTVPALVPLTIPSPNTTNPFLSANSSWDRTPTHRLGWDVPNLLGCFGGLFKIHFGLAL